MTEIEPIDWEARLRAAVEKTLVVRERRRNERAALTKARNAGLQRRHANKLARNQGPEGHAEPRTPDNRSER